MEKICSMCKISLPATSNYFAGRCDRRVPQLQGICRNCQRDYRKVHYYKNKQKYVDKARSYSKAFIAWFVDLKSTLSCEICGERRHWVLDFHHTNPNNKEGDVAGLIRLSNKKRILDEIEKCRVLCSNCHRNLHYQEKLAA